MPTSPPRDEPLSPFIPPLEQDVREALSALLTLPIARWTPDGEGLQVEAGALTLRLEGFRGDRGRLRLAEAQQASNRPPPDPATARRDRQTLRAALGQESITASVQTLGAAVAAWEPFAAMRDTQFRQLHSSPMGDHAVLRIGYRCNQDCLFCWQGRRWPSPPVERYHAWLDELAAAGVKDVHFTGGEATTYRALPALMARARDHGMVISLQTNAIRLAKPDYLARLVDAGLKTVQVSYHSADPQISDRLTRAPGTHTKTVEGVRAVLAAGLRLTLTCVVEQDNVDGLAEHAADIVARFVAPFPGGQLMRVTYAHPTSYFEDDLWQARQVPFDRVRGPLAAACRTLADAGVPIQIAGPCGFPLCLLRGHEDLIDAQVVRREIFTEDELKHRHYAPVCQGCSRRAECFGLREEYLDRFGEAGLTPF